MLARSSLTSASSAPFTQARPAVATAGPGAGHTSAPGSVLPMPSPARDRAPQRVAAVLDTPAPRTACSPTSANNALERACTETLGSIRRAPTCAALAAALSAGATALATVSLPPAQRTNRLTTFMRAAAVRIQVLNPKGRLDDLSTLVATVRRLCPETCKAAIERVLWQSACSAALNPSALTFAQLDEHIERVIAACAAFGRSPLDTPAGANEPLGHTFARAIVDRAMTVAPCAEGREAAVLMVHLAAWTRQDLSMATTLLRQATCLRYLNGQTSLTLAQLTDTLADLTRRLPSHTQVAAYFPQRHVQTVQSQLETLVGATWDKVREVVVLGGHNLLLPRLKRCLEQLTTSLGMPPMPLQIEMQTDHDAELALALAREELRATRMA